MSSNGTVETRRQEAAEASAVLGLSDRSCLGLAGSGVEQAQLSRWKPSYAKSGG